MIRAAACRKGHACGVRVTVRANVHATGSSDATFELSCPGICPWATQTQAEHDKGMERACRRFLSDSEVTLTLTRSSNFKFAPSASHPAHSGWQLASSASSRAPLLSSFLQCQ